MSPVTLPSRIAFLDGRFVPEPDALVPFRHAGGGVGGTVSTRTRTFRGRPFRIEAHIADLFAALGRHGIDPGLGPDEILATCRELLQRNQDALARHGDVWLGVRVMRATDPVPGEPVPGPAVVVDCAPLPFGYWSDLYRDGARVVVPAGRRPSAGTGGPWAVLAAEAALAVADAEVRAGDAGAWSVLLDENGHLSEGLGAHPFVVRAGEILTPRRAPIRDAIWRAAVIEIARADQFPVVETDIRLSALMAADEVFLAAAGPCLLRCVSVNGQTVGRGGGPVTRRLFDAYRLAVDCDFVAQAAGAAAGR